MSDEGLHQLDEWLLALLAGLGARGGGLGLGGGQHAAGRGRGGAPPKVAGQAGQQGALRGRREGGRWIHVEHNVPLSVNVTRTGRRRG